MGDTSQAELFYVEESTWGTTPSSPTLKELRFTGESLRQTTQTKVSEEIRGDRQIPDVIRTQIGVEGDINAEVSYGTLDDLFAGAFMADWQTDTPSTGTDRLENGTSLKSFTFEKKFGDISEFISYTGITIDQLSLVLEPEEVIRATLSVIGKQEVPAGATVGDGSPTAVNPNEVLNTIDHITSIKEGGSAADILRLELQLANNLRTKPILGQLGPKDAGLGRCIVTGRIEAYFENRTLYEKYTNATASSVEFTVNDGTNQYVVKVPNLRFTDGGVLVEGNDDDLVAGLDIHAMLDATSGKTIQLERS